jgi:hypothetical protein
LFADNSGAIASASTTCSTGQAEGRVVHPRVTLIQRLDSHQHAVIVHIPHRNGIGRTVYPSAAIVRVRFREFIHRPALGTRIKTDELPAVQYASPDIAILVWHRFVEVRDGTWRGRWPVFHDPPRTGVQFNQGSIAATEPGLSGRIESAALGGCIMRAGIQTNHASRLNIQTLCRIARERRPATRPVFSVSGDEIVVAEICLIWKSLQDLAGDWIYFPYITTFVVPHRAIWRESKVRLEFA